MIDIKALAAAGLTNDFLKKVFTTEEETTAKPKSPPKAKKAKGLTETVTATAMLPELPENPSLIEVRRYWEARLMARAQEGVARCAQNFNIFAAIDLAYSAKPIHPMSLPLMRVAEGMISLEDCQKQISGLTECSRKALFEKDAAGKITGIKAPQLVDISHNLVYSLTARRVAAVATEVMKRYPLNVWNPFSNSQEGKLRGDIMTQLGEQMAGAYNYRGDVEESTRAASLYGYSVKFKANAWHCEKQKLPKSKKPDNGAKGAGADEKIEYEDRVVREGVLSTLPHPSRVYHDIAHPMRQINNDLGPEFMGHWGVTRVGAIKSNPAYFNKDKAIYSTSLNGFFTGNAAYFAQYCPDQIRLANGAGYGSPGGGSAAGLALDNDRVAHIGADAATMEDVSTTINYHYERVIPKDVGFGDYPYPVWIRFDLAAQQTVCYAEIVGSPPASVNAYNKSDNLLMSPSFAMQVLPYQEQLTNILTEIMRVQYQGMVRIWTLNKQGMSPADIDILEKAIQYPDFANVHDIIIKYDALQLQDRGQDPRTLTTKLEQVKVETKEKLTELFATMIQLLSIAERLLFFSPQELGQVSPRTITAEEMKSIDQTTLGIRDFHLVGINQQLEADKRIIHSSYMAFGTEDLEVPVAERYAEEVIAKAGFEIVDRNDDGLFTVRGKKLGLLYNYTYTTRNTDDLPPSAAVIQGLSQALEIVQKDPELQALMGTQDKVDTYNQLFTLLTGGSVKIKVDPARIQEMTAQKESQAQLGQALPAIQQALQALAESMKGVSERQAKSDASITALSKAIVMLAKGSQAPAERVPNTQAGQIAPGFPVGSGAPPLNAPIAQPIALAS